MSHTPLYLSTVLICTLFGSVSQAQGTASPAPVQSAPQVATSCAVPPTLNGQWQADDGSTYTIRQIGSQIWWIGKSKDNGQSWTNVFSGTVKGKVVTGQWSDVSGTRRSNGLLTLLGNTTYGFADFKRVSGTGPTATRWIYTCNDAFNVPAP